MSRTHHPRKKTTTPKWSKTEWGWQARAGGYLAQVYADTPIGWRIFRGAKIVAQGDASLRVAKQRGMAVLEALAPTYPKSRKRGGG